MTLFVPFRVEMVRGGAGNAAGTTAAITIEKRAAETGNTRIGVHTRPPSKRDGGFSRRKLRNNLQDFIRQNGYTFA